MSAASPYPELSQLLSDSHAVTEPAEAHGTLVGALCAISSYALSDWLAEILPEGAIPAATNAALAELYGATVESLRSTEMQFDLLMPDDTDSLEERARALGLWCNGFLYGLGSNGAADPRQLSTDVAEIVQDLGEISRAGVDGQDSEESNEMAFAELVEFVRVGVQLVFEELSQKRTSPPMLAPSATLH